ncbi:uncharacterized protein N7483_011552 [Penicillium malachiteum]|uniref:uncharacterized protein n=1 Tax=Penicillium malachiteum TaxID=1324776 RepID=UPI0025465926|nr:uncharacterized protein N7483_011552 [Penicillium malachiteum]KAJ5714371.1 hypothetical protein N7483_011552 [Penicillium malachiteum]
MLLKNLKTALESPDVREVIDGDSQLRQALNDLLDPIENCHQDCLQIQQRLERHFQPETSFAQNLEVGLFRGTSIEAGYLPPSRAFKLQRECSRMPWGI